jgi:NAD+ diphosphatase
MTAYSHSLPGFCGGTLDRADHIRTDPVALQAAFADRAARVLALDGLDPVYDGEALAREMIVADARLDDHVLLGLDNGQPLFARLEKGIPHGAAPSQPSRNAAMVLDVPELAIYGTARSLVDWHARHGFCPACGGRTAPTKGGWSRQCEGCNAEHFPRVDPVTIMLAEYQDKVLIGRQHSWPQGRYSALAGFVEPGETVEEAVARELFEEAGVRATHVDYVMSQPWPFPSSLMIACVAQVESDRIIIDTNELEDAIWVDADDVRAAMEGRNDAKFLAPSVMAVAYHLFAHWLNTKG